MALQCEIFGARDATGPDGRKACHFEDSALPRIVGIVDVGTSLLFYEVVALAKVDMRKMPRSSLGFIPIDMSTDKRWRDIYGVGMAPPEPPLPSGKRAHRKDYIELFDRKGKNSGLSLYYRKNEMDKVIRENPREEYEVFY